MSCVRQEGYRARKIVVQNNRPKRLTWIRMTTEDTHTPAEETAVDAPEAPEATETAETAEATAAATNAVGPPDAPTTPDTPEDAAPKTAEERIEEEFGEEQLRLKLDNFEGPFEVLLYLIKAQEIDIFDIPIVKVTEQYLAFLELLREENLEVAGEFLVLAATLIQIKSKMILPVEVDEDEEEELEEDDPRLELVEKLLEYRKYRDLAQALGGLEEAREDCFGRRVKPVFEAGDEDEEEYLEVSLYDLLRAVRSIMRFLTEQAYHQVEAEGISVDEKIEQIEELLVDRDTLTWTELRSLSHSKFELVCCLLAILELCRMGRVRAHQHRVYGDIRIFARPAEEAPVPPAGGDSLPGV